MDLTLRKFQIILERISKVSMYFGGTLLVSSAALVSIAVISRKIFNLSIVGADELTGYAYALSMAWGFSYTLFQGGHIRVDSLYIRLPVYIRSFLDIIALLAFAFVIYFLTYRIFNVLEETLHLKAVSSSPLQVPLWIPQTILLLGLILFSFSISVLFIRSCLAFFTANLPLVGEITNSPSIIDKKEPRIGREKQ